MLMVLCLRWWQLDTIPRVLPSHIEVRSVLERTDTRKKYIMVHHVYSIIRKIANWDHAFLSIGRCSTTCYRDSSKISEMKALICTKPRVLHDTLSTSTIRKCCRIV